jgi:hypothetical protein
MLRCWLVVLAVMLSCANGWAQSGDRVEVFGGYSYAARDFSSGTIGNGGLKLGWNASLNLKYSRLLGFVSDFGGHYNHQNSAGVCAGGMTSCSSSGYTAMFGPQVSFPLPKITPFSHALFGIAHAIQNGTSPVDPFQGNNAFVAALGGGLDYHHTRHFALRGQGDYLLTRFTYSDNQLHFNNNNVRISAGLVVRL